MTDNAELMTLQKMWTVLKLIAPTIFENGFLFDRIDVVWVNIWKSFWN